MTIPISKIFIDYAEAKKILKYLEINYVEEISKASSLHKSDFSEEFIKHSYKNDILETYKVARKFSDYNLLINDDGSFFQFGHKLSEDKHVSELRYAYYESPNEQISYHAFLEEMGLSYEKCGDMFHEEYSQYIAESELKNNVTNIRYDFSLNQRKEITHPVSHIHIGQQNEIRIPLSFIMTPKSFVSFIIRHIYWGKWRIAMENPEFKDKYLSSYSSGVSLDNSLFSSEEKKDLYLNYNI